MGGVEPPVGLLVVLAVTKVSGDGLAAGKGSCSSKANGLVVSGIVEFVVAGGLGASSAVAEAGAGEVGGVLEGG